MKLFPDCTSSSMHNDASPPTQVIASVMEKPKFMITIAIFFLMPISPMGTWKAIEVS